MKYHDHVTSRQFDYNRVCYATLSYLKRHRRLRARTRPSTGSISLCVQLYFSGLFCRLPFPDCRRSVQCVLPRPRSPPPPPHIHTIFRLFSSSLSIDHNTPKYYNFVLSSPIFRYQEESFDLIRFRVIYRVGTDGGYDGRSAVIDSDLVLPCLILFALHAGGLLVSEAGDCFRPAACIY